MLGTPRHSCQPAAAAAALLLGSAAGAQTIDAQAVAGSAIDNVAQLDYVWNGRQVTVRSNRARFAVGEKLDVTLTPATVPTAAGAVVAATDLINEGNGQEAFAVTATLSAGGGTIVRLAIDDGDGNYDPARDREVIDGRTALLAPRARLRLFAVVSDRATGTVTFAASAVTGTGAPGTAFPGAGDGGSDAVIGPTSARATATASFGGGSGASPTLTKNATVIAPDGGSRAIRGATIGYTLLATFPAAVDGAQVADPIPAGTRYVPASLTLDGTPLSDAADGDAGEGSADRVAVALGPQAAGARRTIRFQVVIQ